MPKEIDISTLDQPPVGSEFRVDRVIAVTEPHPYMITSRHVSIAADQFGGMLNEQAIAKAESQGVRCGMRDCQLSYSKHTTMHGLSIVVPQNKDLNAVKGLHAFLLSIKDKATALGIDGFLFPTAAQAV